MLEFDSKNLPALLELLNLVSKAEVKRHCRDLIVSSNDFAALILAGKIGELYPYVYTSHFLETVPQHLAPSESEQLAVSRTGVGKLPGDAKKFFTKINQIFLQRRMFAAHLLATSDQAYWHLFYFDQRDFSTEQNHWKEGPHIHYANDRFHRDSLESIMARVQTGDTAFLKAVHIPYVK